MGTVARKNPYQVQKRSISLRRGNANIIVLLFLLTTVTFLVTVSNIFLHLSSDEISAAPDVSMKRHATTIIWPELVEPAKLLPPVFVCITGQLQRLELHSKLKTVLTPLREAGFEPYIALMLTNDSEVRYTNHYTDIVDEGIQGHPFNNYTHARSFLMGHGFHVTTDHPIVQPLDPTITEGYYNKVGLRAKVGSNPELRVANHVRQFHTLMQCGEEMTRGQRQYRFSIRVREDVSLVDPLRVKELYQQLYSVPGTNRTVIATDCRRYTGMNDRMAIISSEASYLYFHSPFMALYTQILHEEVWNPESFLLTTYERSGLSVIHSNLLRFVVKLKPNSDGSIVIRKGGDGPVCPDHACLPAHVWDDPRMSQFLQARRTFRCSFHYLQMKVGFTITTKEGESPLFL